tara:strand:- start:90 stop:251 length:162 start_codon:yes stop_codon:yes gene_type:complete
MQLNQITEHAISEFQRIRIDALEKENKKLKEKNDRLEQQVANLKRDLVSKQTR